jgi:hypothetical protein
MYRYKTLGEIKRMIYAKSNLSLISPSRKMVVEPMRFVDLEPALQIPILEWLQQRRFGFLDVLANTLICSRWTIIYHIKKGLS